MRRRKSMTIDATEAAIRQVIANAIVEHTESSGRGLDALFALRQAEAIVKALEHAGYQIRRRGEGRFEIAAGSGIRNNELPAQRACRRLQVCDDGLGRRKRRVRLQWPLADHGERGNLIANSTVEH
jgi:hypothetical protein